MGGPPIVTMRNQLLAVFVLALAGCEASILADGLPSIPDIGVLDIVAFGTAAKLATVQVEAPEYGAAAPLRAWRALGLMVVVIAVSAWVATETPPRCSCQLSCRCRCPNVSGAPFRCQVPGHPVSCAISGNRKPRGAARPRVPRNRVTLCTARALARRASRPLSAGLTSFAAMTSQSFASDRSDLRVFVYAFALILPPLLAYNRTPSATQLNELLCVLGWGLCMLVGNPTPPAGARRGAVTVLVVALALVCAAILGSWTIGSLPTSLALPPLLLLVTACFVAALASRFAQGGDQDGLQAFAPFAIGMVSVGVLSALISIIQVYAPGITHFAEGQVIAQSGLPGRAVGNLRQPNHLASLLVWSVITLVPLVEWRRVPRWLGLAIGALIMAAVVLSGSRTGLYGGTGVLVLWGLCDTRLSRSTRAALVASILFPLGIHAWQWLSTHASFLPHAAIGTATRASDGDSSHFAIWKNAIEMVRQQPLLGVGWGEFNFAWTLTPFPHRPTAFFDHTHDLPLQLVVELGVPLAALVLGLMVWALVQGLLRAWATQGEAGHGARAAWVMILMIAIHSLDEYPLWYAYFLLPAAWAWGFTLGCGPAPRPAAEPALSGVGGGRPVDPGKLIRLSSEGAALRWFGGAMVAVALVSTWDYWRVSTIFLDDEGLAPLKERIQAGQTSPFFAHHADYAAATTAEPASLALGALERSTHSLLDSRLMMAWANALSESGQTDRARYLVARLKEFDKTDTEEFFAPCANASVTPKPFQCQPEPTGLTWRDFR